MISGFSEFLIPLWKAFSELPVCSLILKGTPMQGFLAIRGANETFRGAVASLSDVTVFIYQFVFPLLSLSGRNIKQAYSVKCSQEQIEMMGEAKRLPWKDNSQDGVSF